VDEQIPEVRLSAIKHLDEASTSVTLNIAEGNGTPKPARPGDRRAR
jgi:hypothetical protein